MAIRRTRFGRDVAPPVRMGNSWPPDWPTGQLDLWETSTGKRTGPALLHHSRILELQFSPDNKLLAVGAVDGTVQLLNTATREPHGPLMQHGEGIARYLTFSPDGALLAVGSGRGLRLGTRSGTFPIDEYTPIDEYVSLWQVATCKAQCEPLAIAGGAWKLAFNQDGSLLAADSLGSGTVQLWQTADGASIGPPIDRGARWAPSAFTPDLSLVAAGTSDSTHMVLWNPTTGRRVGEPMKHQTGGKAIAFSPDGKLLVTGEMSGQIRFWNTQTQQQLGETLHAGGPVISLVFSPDGRLVAAGTGFGQVRLVSSDSGKWYGHPLPRRGVRGKGMGFSPDSGQLSMVTTRGLWIWRVDPVLPTARTLPSETDGRVVAYSRTGKLLAIGVPGKLQLWNPENGQPLGSAMAIPEEIQTIAFRDQDNQLAVVSSNGTVRLLDTRTGEPAERTWSCGPLMAAAFSPEAKFLMTTSDRKNSRIWEIDKRQTMRDLPLDRGDRGLVRRPAFSPNGQWLVAGGKTWGINLWNTASWELHHSTMPAQVNEVAFHPNAKDLLVTFDGGNVRLLDLITGKVHGREVKLRGDASSLTFSPDGRRLAIAIGNVVELWNTELGLVPEGITLPHSGTVHDLAFSPKGDQLVIGSEGPTRIWALPSAPEDIEEMELRTWVALAARKNAEDEVEYISSGEWQKLRKQLQSLEESRLR